MIRVRSKVGRQALSNYLRFAIAMVVPIVLTPQMISQWGNELFGLWTLVCSVLSLFGLLDLGLAVTLIRYLGEYRAKGEREAANRLLATVLQLYLLLSLLGTGLLLFLGMKLPLLQVARQDALLWLLGARAVTLGLPLGVLKNALYAEQEYIFCNLWQSVVLLGYGAVAWLLLQAQGTPEMLALLQMAVCLLEHTGYLMLLFRRVEGFRLLWCFDKGEFKRVWSFSLAASVSTLAGLVLLKTDPILVAYFLPLSAVGTYALALKVAEGFLLLLKQAVNVLAPHFAEMLSGGRELEARQLFLKWSTLLFRAALLFALPLVWGAGHLFELWVGEGFQGAVWVTRILILSGVCSIPQMVGSVALTMGGHHRFTALAACVGAFLNLGLSALLASYWGLLGIALGTLGATLVVDLAWVLPKALKFLGLSPRDYYSSILGFPQATTRKV